MAVDFEEMRRELIYDLLRFSLSDAKADFDDFKEIRADEWQWSFVMLSMHGVAPLVGGALEKIPSELRPQRDILMQFIAANMSSIRSYEKLKGLSERLREVMMENEIKCLSLKGLSLAEYYPRADLRKFMDIDLYAPDSSHKIDEVFVSRGVKVNTDFYRHSHMTLDGVLVENHHCLLDVRGRKRMAELDADLRAMALERLDSFDVSGLYHPDARFALIFNLHHAMSHFIYEGISFKFLVDWVMFLRREKVYLTANKNVLASDLRRHGLMKFAAVMSEVSVRHLGLTLEDVPEYIFAEMVGLKPRLVEMFEDDLFRPYEPSHKKNLLAERVNNARRIIKSSWKPKEFLDQSAFGFVWDKLVPIMLGQKFEAD